MMWKQQSLTVSIKISFSLPRSVGWLLQSEIIGILFLNEKKEKKWVFIDPQTEILDSWVEVVRQWLFYMWEKLSNSGFNSLWKVPPQELIDDLCGNALIMFCLRVLLKIYPTLQTVKTFASGLCNDRLICLLNVHSWPVKSPGCTA